MAAAFSCFFFQRLFKKRVNPPIQRFKNKKKGGPLPPTSVFARFKRIFIGMADVPSGLLLPDRSSCWTIPCVARDGGSLRWRGTTTEGGFNWFDWIIFDGVVEIHPPSVLLLHCWRPAPSVVASGDDRIDVEGGRWILWPENIAADGWIALPETAVKIGVLRFDAVIHQHHGHAWDDELKVQQK